MSERSKPEKHLLLLLTRGVLTTLALLCLANARASVRMYIVWYPHGYANQPATAQEGATIGGWFTLRLVVQPQSGYILNASATSATLTEQTSAHAVTPSNLQFQVSSARYPGDPQSNAIILESLQNLSDRHNGQYRVEFSVSYTVSTGNPPPNDRRTFTESGSFTFNALNLLLVDSRSDPYVVWKPEQMSGIGFSAQLLHAQSGTCRCVWSYLIAVTTRTRCW
ncbi:MAG: hypothetical protein KatS3mg022_3245 [Armatimonadota bacterium]|nr:MAG: hypothetical protein KatS3mg022_3245 [Armatimonadota bacterium]